MTIEHIDIPNSELHEPKDISAATAGRVYTSNGAGSGNWDFAELDGQDTALEGEVPVANGGGGVIWTELNNFSLNLDAEDFSPQIPTGVDAPLQLTFGGTQSGIDWNVAANGEISCTSSGTFFTIVTLYISRDTSAGVANLFVRFTVNGIQTDNPISIFLTDDEITIPLQFSTIIPATIGDIIRVEMVRDSGGQDSGSLEPHTSSIGWGTSPSASLTIYRVG